MDDGDYQAALTVLRHARTQLERTPSVAAKLGEEEIRNLLLIALNTHFEGDATAEAFNGNGKTDILIRVEDRNIFIGECKIWDGVGVIDQALTQLTGYLWRDTKAAILLFIRNKNVTAVIAKAVERIEQHPCYKRRGPRDDDEQIDFVCTLRTISNGRSTSPCCPSRYGPTRRRDCPAGLGCGGHRAAQVRSLPLRRDAPRNAKRKWR